MIKEVKLNINSRWSYLKHDKNERSQLSYSPKGKPYRNNPPAATLHEAQRYMDPIEIEKRKLLTLEKDFLKQLDRDRKRNLTLKDDIYLKQLKKEKEKKEEMAIATAPHYDEKPGDESFRSTFTDVATWRQPPSNLSPRRYSPRRVSNQNYENNQSEIITSPSKYSKDNQEENVLVVTPPPNREKDSKIDMDTIERLNALKDTLEIQVQTLNSEIKNRYSKFQEALIRNSTSSNKSDNGFEKIKHPRVPTEEDCRAILVAKSSGIHGTPPKKLEIYRTKNSNSKTNLNTSSVYDLYNDSLRKEENSDLKVISKLEEEVNLQHKRLIDLGLVKIVNHNNV